MILKLLQVLSVRVVRHPAIILLLEGANDPSSCILVRKWASIAAVLGPNTPVVHSRIKLPQDLPVVPPLDIFILAVPHRQTTPIQIVRQIWHQINDYMP